MLFTFNNAQQPTISTSNAWTLQNLQDHVDSLPNGFYWLYITGRSMNTITNGVIRVWASFIWFKRALQTNCIFIPSTSAYPIGYLRKDATWDTQVSFRDIPGQETTNFPGGCEALAESMSIGENRVIHVPSASASSMGLPVTSEDWTLQINKWKVGYATIVAFPYSAEHKAYRKYQNHGTWSEWIEM